ncbi:tRNA uridine-5-carboxymethylaminomethyl(34) synthesis GTPase MnmE [Bartonella sp. TP]|uniref:tRNA uridine-5-carboxymethylaminomethyl(34) synthesis GTPase MnmE n=1 Tax=Bartonella sp. TP TaxID=3057550 RepID=UPI0025B14735|nr:tRNA uridine-5-carboxymethylaminomethyl(34) synthesis GTPase MnmE [Bartonella sp. TP]WJW79493.1 tRNA uridine-5-carboxymethylaminomethyl(34) synthesis GTPase MnmE [Bartonella sp. TP]
METIYALSSGSLPCAIAIIRVSGPNTRNIVQSITANIVIKPRYMHYAALKTATNEILDYGMVAYFPAPNSFTGEDCAEFHLHGSKAVVAAFLTELSFYKNTRQAFAGEFSRRAFMNGKIDLVQAESLADLLEAETESQRRLSILGASKQTTQLYANWRELLLKAMAFIEAELDFSTEEDIAAFDNNKIWQNIADLAKQLRTHLSFVKISNIMQNGLKIVIIGPPNAGKSSLINKLCGRELAIVTPQAGTTRDVIEGKLILHGVEVFLFDTAGLRDTEDEIEKIGINKALDQLQNADIVFYIHDATGESTVNIPKISAPIWFINNKIDKTNINLLNVPECSKNFAISIKNDIGIARLREALELYLLEYLPKYGTIIPAKQRHIELLQKTLDSLDLAIASIDLPTEIRAEYLRIAASDLGKIIGKIDVENILDIVFSQFCIGK